ncbi:MAG TPA: FtsX-like permease family protein, partial [Fimbriimonadaceae bacterium]|nr:FtsX-like permease family protein [Fimbriimonadaceae bacterium]
MSALNKKLWRDLWRMKWQYAAVSLMILLGVAFYGAATTSYQNLHTSYEYSYDRLNFEDIGISMVHAPERVVQRITSIPGVVAAEGRLVEDVAVELPDRDSHKLIGRLISIPADRPASVNDLRIVEGSQFSSPTAREVLLEASFATQNNLHPGDTIEVSSGSAKIDLLVRATVRSPEYIYVVRSKQDILPMPGTFGVMFVSQDVLGPLVGRSGQINEVKARTASGADRERIAKEMKARLATYRPDDAVLREDQPSHQLLQQDLDGFRMYAILFPLLFLSVSALTVYTLMTRTVHLQRPVIGLLRALGFSRGAVILHYLSAATIIGLIGSVVGSALGVWLGKLLTDYYLSQIAVPYERAEADPKVLAIGIVMGALVCLVAGAWPANVAARISPAETMRGNEIEGGRVLCLDRLFPGLPLLWRIPVRNLFRQWRRTASTLFGIVAGIALIMIGQGLLDSVTVTMDQLSATMFADDLRVEFIEYQDPGVVSAVRHWPGVVWAEGALDVPAEFLFGDKVYSAAISGLEPGSQEHTVKDKEGRPFDLNKEGVVLGNTIQRRLGVRVGQTIQVRLPAMMRREDVTRTEAVRVIGVCDEPIGTVAYAGRNLLWRLFKEQLDMPPNAISSVRLQVQPERSEEVRRRLYQLSDVGAVSSVGEMRDMIDKMMSLFRQFVNYMLAFGAALAFSIVFSTVTINVLERTN